MRVKQKTKMISVSQQTYERIIKDKQHFQETIGGGKWSINDTIKEYHKILNTK